MRREPITASMVANLFQAAGLNHLVTLDLHAAQIEGFFHVAVDNLKAVPTPCDQLKHRLAPGTVVASPDEGRERLAEYMQLGARFTKWRVVISVGANIPSRTCLEANAHALSRFATLSQEAGLVLIVEPEVLMDGAPTIQRHFDVTEATGRDTWQTRGDGMISPTGPARNEAVASSGES